MPSVSAKQHKFMEAVAHNPKFAKKVGVSQEVGKEFQSADKSVGKYNKKRKKKRRSARVPVSVVQGGLRPYAG